ncbi:MAG: aminotransferase class I/II-fold pyridoxal phosphate-dependent enzyme [Thermodesulfobacteriota bacterium]
MARFKEDRGRHTLQLRVYLANVGTISSLVGEGDVVYSDELNHASIIDGCRLSKAEIKIYPHLDTRPRIAPSRTAQRRKYRKLVVTDTVFSMDGDVAPAQGITELSGNTARRSWWTRRTHWVLGKRHGRRNTSAYRSARAGCYGHALEGSGLTRGLRRREPKLIDFIRNRVRATSSILPFRLLRLRRPLAAIRIIENEPERGRLWSSYAASRPV